jgi:hypothetical protein
VNARRQRVGFTVSYASTAIVALHRLRAREWRAVRRFALPAEAGRNSARLRPRALPAGRYRVRASAKDGAGNRSEALVARFRVVAGR